MNVDVALVGGGLANSLIAFRMLARRPQVKLLMLEQASRLGGIHTWSFHEGDLSAEQHRWMRPFVEHAWPYYDVKFPRLERRLSGGYYSFTGARLHSVMDEALRDRLWLGANVEQLGPERVRLEDGRVIEARVVIDGRGEPRSTALRLAYQKFFGQEVELARPHGLAGPILMDATVEQLDGYRFIYVLPHGDRGALVEDTRYSDSPSLGLDDIRENLAQYVTATGWEISAIKGEEQGVLPIVLSGDIEAFWEEAPRDIPRVGMRAALFNPITGYSLPDAVRLADDICESADWDSRSLYSAIRSRSIAAWRKNRFSRLLNRMLFEAARPEARYRVLERFYRLPAPLIQRFYAGRLTLADRARLVSGVPPVPIHRALPCLLGDGETAGRRTPLTPARSKHDAG